MSGLYLEDLEPGKRFRHEPGRTVTETDNLLFSTLSMNPQPLHLDAEFAAKSQFGRILVNSLFTLSTLVGLSVRDTTLGTTIGNLGFEKVEFPNPVFIGDTLYAETVVLERRESKTKPDRGIVTFEHRATNQRGELVARCVRQAMMLRRPASAAGGGAS
jgi:acyl dehydratase